MSDDREAPARPKAVRRVKPGRRVKVPGDMLANNALEKAGKGPDKTGLDKTGLEKTGLGTTAMPGERIRERMPFERSAFERLAFERFVERSLHEAYQDTLRQEVPARFVQLLDRLNAHKGAD